MPVDFSPSLGQGFLLSVSIDDGVSWTPVGGVQAPGKFGSKGSEVDVTPIDHTSPKYMAGMTEGEARTISFMRDPNDPGQNLLIAAKGTEIMVKGSFTNTEEATQSMTVLGYEYDESKKNTANMASVSGRMNGEPLWA